MRNRERGETVGMEEGKKGLTRKPVNELARGEKEWSGRGGQLPNKLRARTHVFAFRNKRIYEHSRQRVIGKSFSD